jgi:hypothetical protein
VRVLGWRGLCPRHLVSLLHFRYLSIIPSVLDVGQQLLG